MNEQNPDNLLSEIERLHQYSEKLEKERPPVSPNPTLTREYARKSMEKLLEKIENAKLESKKTKKKVNVSGSDLSGITSGDFWEVDETGVVGRFFEENHGLLEGLLQRRSERVADTTRDVDFDLLMKILSYAQWAPNATNEQPTKILIYKKDHSSMDKIGELMKKALEEKIVPQITLKNYIVAKKRENNDFLPDYSLEKLVQMPDADFKTKFESLPAPLDELPLSKSKLLERDKIIEENGKFYGKASNGKGNIYTMKDLLNNDVVFTKGMGKFFLKFKNTHPYLIVVLRKWQYTSLMTETLYKYGIALPEIGEEFIDAGLYTDYLALTARGFGLSGVIKSGPLDLAKDELHLLFIDDTKERMEILKTQIKNTKSESLKKTLEKELLKNDVIYKGLKAGVDLLKCKKENLPLSRELLETFKRGEIYVPAAFYQMGYPLPLLEERINDPRQGKNPMDSMVLLM